MKSNQSNQSSLAKNHDLINVRERTSAARRHKISFHICCWYLYCTESDLIAGTFFPIICSQAQNTFNEACLEDINLNVIWHLSFLGKAGLNLERNTLTAYDAVLFKFTLVQIIQDLSISL